MKRILRKIRWKWRNDIGKELREIKDRIAKIATTQTETVLYCVCDARADA